eukprot:1134494-Pelagomonas_calceolata.AAC.5
MRQFSKVRLEPGAPVSQVELSQDQGALFSSSIINNLGILGAWNQQQQQQHTLPRHGRDVAHFCHGPHDKKKGREEEALLTMLEKQQVQPFTAG